MKIDVSQEELDFIIAGLDELEDRYVGDYHTYCKQDNDEAANDSLDYFRRVFDLKKRLREFNIAFNDVQDFIDEL